MAKHKIAKRRVKTQQQDYDFNEELEITNYPSRTDFKIEQLPYKWTDKQNEIIKCILDKNTKFVMENGPAGVGKTELAVYAGLRLLQKGEIDKLIYIRTMVESAAHSLGFLKGDLDQKTGVYMEVLHDKLDDLLSIPTSKKLIEEKRIVAIPNNFLRGKDFKRSLIILDEAQCANFAELQTIISRISEESKIIFIFDPAQSDVKKNKNDILKFTNIFRDQESVNNGIHYFEFNHDDIKRSEFCKFVMKKIENYNNSDLFRPL